MELIKQSHKILIIYLNNILFLIFISNVKLNDYKLFNLIIQIPTQDILLYNMK
jgi:hypothetical protein